MRVRIIFILKNKGANVPFHHQFLLAQLIKGILVKGGQERYKDYQFFNFSGLKGQTKISRNGLHFYSSRITLVLSSINQDFIDYFLKELFSFPQIEIGNLVLVPEAVEKETIPEMGEDMKYICISPLVLIRPSFNDAEGKKFIMPDTDDFSDLLYESTIRRMKELGYYDEKQIASFFKFQVVPDKNYLTKIEENQKKFARIYPVFDQDVKYEVRGYTFPFKLYAAKEVQEFVFQCGMGVYSYKGFGMLDLANIDPTGRTSEYKF